jgi:hypothetical protein
MGGFVRHLILILDKSTEIEYINFRILNFDMGGIFIKYLLIPRKYLNFKFEKIVSFS